jgi:hypothetical protein
MSKLKRLEVKKLLKELDFIESDFNYKNEIVFEADSNFIKSVNDLLEKHPMLKDIINKKNNKRADLVFSDIIKEALDKDDEILEEEELVEDFINEEFVIEIDPKEVKMKKLYRDIAKLTHPDKIVSEKLNDLYLKSTKFYKNSDITGIYYICDELGITYEIDDTDNEMITGKINNLKNRISFMESTLTWRWYHSDSEKEKEQIVLSYIKMQLDN